MQVGRTIPPLPQPEGGISAGRVALDIGLSVGVGIAADRIRKAALARGTAQSVILGLIGGAAFKAVAEGSIQVIGNVRRGEDWSKNVGHKLLDGARTGSIDAGLTFLAGPIQNGVANRFPRLGMAGRTAVTGLVIGTMGGAATSGTNVETWRHGVGNGLLNLGVSTAIGGAGGALIGGATGAVMKRVVPQFRRPAPTVEAPAAASTGAPGVDKRGLPFPSLAKFHQRFPFDPANPGRAQTMVQTQHGSYAVTGYDPTTGMVKLSQEVTVLSQAYRPVKVPGFEGGRIDPQTLVPGAVLKTKVAPGAAAEEWQVVSYASRKLKLERVGGENPPATMTVKVKQVWEHRMRGLGELKPSDMTAGKKVSLDGADYTVQGFNDHGSGRVHLKGVSEVTVPLDGIKSALRNHSRPTPAGAPVQLEAPTVTDKLRALFGLQYKRLIPVVGKQDVHLVSQQASSVVYENGPKALSADKVLGWNHLPEGTVIQHQVGTTTDTFRIGSLDGRKVAFREMDFAPNMARRLMGKPPSVGDTAQSGSTMWRVGAVGDESVTLQLVLDKEAVAFEKLAVGTDGHARLTVTHPGKPPQSMGLRQLPAGAGRILVDDAPTTSTVYRFRLGKGTDAPEVEVAIPNRTNGEPDKGMIKDVQEMLANLPKEHADAQGYIRINRHDNAMDLYWRQIGQFDSGGKSAATAGPAAATPSGRNVRVTDFYPTGISATTRFSQRLDTFWHESGHHIARKLWGRPNAMPSQEWIRVMNADARFVSDYAQSNAAEDFAEAIAAYLQSDAGRLNASLRGQFRHRFELLDRVFGIDSNLAEVHAAMQQSMRRLRIGIAGTAGAGATGLILLDRSRRHSQPQATLAVSPDTK